MLLDRVDIDHGYFSGVLFQADVNILNDAAHDHIIKGIEHENTIHVHHHYG